MPSKEAAVIKVRLGLRLCQSVTEHEMYEIYDCDTLEALSKPIPANEIARIARIMAQSTESEGA